MHTTIGTRGMVGFEHGGMEVRRGGARRAQQDRGATGCLAEPEGEERRRSLVEVDVQPDAIVGREGERERRRPRAGCEARVGHAVSDPLVDERARRRRWLHPGSWDAARAHAKIASVRFVFVPGFTQSAASWQPTIDRRASADPLIDAVALEVPDGLDFASTAAAIGDAGGPAMYVGYSMGGRLCLQLALDHPELVKRLVLVSASPGIADADERAARRAADEELALGVERDGVDAFLERWLAQPMFASLPPELAGLDERRRVNTVERLTHQLRVLGQGAQPSNWDRLDEIEMRSLLFAGGEDRKYVDIARRMARPMHADLRVVHGGGHACHLEGLIDHLLWSWVASRDAR